MLQRVTGVFLVMFIAWHIYETRIQKALGAEVDFDMMANILSNPFMLAFYIAGVLAATFHLANGVWSFLVTWGITQSPRSQTNRYVYYNGSILSSFCNRCTSTTCIRLINKLH